MACTHTEDCALYPQFRLGASLKLWKLRYCEDDERYRVCARFKLAAEGKAVPLNLLPNGQKLGVG